MAVGQTLVPASVPVAPVQIFNVTGLATGLNSITISLGWVPTYIYFVVEGTTVASWCYNPATLSATNVDIYLSATPSGGLGKLYVG